MQWTFQAIGDLTLAKVASKECDIETVGRLDVSSRTASSWGGDFVPAGGEVITGGETGVCHAAETD